MGYDEGKTIINDNPDRCPVCGSSAIEGGFVEIDRDGAWQRCECLACGVAWVDIYRYKESWLEESL